MARRDTTTGLSGILVIDKPAGMTSHDVVNTLRRLSGERRIGHAGTLDPLATGVLVLCIGPATRLADYLMAGLKTYEARICFGSATNTDDAEGETIQTSELPPGLEDPAFARQFLSEQAGEILQVPPAFSAIKKDGITAYKAARSGAALELEPRRVHLYEAELVTTGKDWWDIRITVSKGFYVRSFARDLGESLGSAAHLGALRRTASGQVSIKQAKDLSSLKTGEPLPYIDPTAALGFPVIEISPAEAQRVQNGMPLTIKHARVRQQSFALAPDVQAEASPLYTTMPKPSPVIEPSITPSLYEPSTTHEHPTLPSSCVSSLVSVVHDGRLLALYYMAGSSGLARPKVVIPGGVAIPA